MVPHAAERLGMKHLRQKRGDPAHHHRGHIAMNAADYRPAREQGIVGSRHRLLAPRLVVEGLADLPDERASDRRQHD
jgi:hypothetical protein